MKKQNKNTDFILMPDVVNSGAEVQSSSSALLTHIYALKLKLYLAGCKLLFYFYFRIYCINVMVTVGINNFYTFNLKDVTLIYLYKTYWYHMKSGTYVYMGKCSTFHNTL